MDKSELPYRNLAGYLRSAYGAPLKKICVDGGFTCPNRDGTCGFGGCLFCGERGAGEHINPEGSIRSQVEAGLTKDAGYIVYFQNFTNTYAPVSVLKERYDAALFDDRIKILDIGTRPDCITDEIAALIADYAKEREVWVELGLQTAIDATADRINRGYHLDTFERAIEILKQYRLKTVVHLIVGLPGESLSEIQKTAEYLEGFDLFGVKIHSLYVMEGTGLANLYQNGGYRPFSLEEYTEGVALLLSHLSENTVIHRLTGDCPDGMLLAPDWSKDKNTVLTAIRNYCTEHGIRQGSARKKGSI